MIWNDGFAGSGSSGQYAAEKAITNASGGSGGGREGDLPRRFRKRFEALPSSPLWARMSSVLDSI